MILGPEQKIILCNCIVSKFLNKSWEYIIILKYRVSDQTNFASAIGATCKNSNNKVATCKV